MRWNEKRKEELKRREVKRSEIELKEEERRIGGEDENILIEERWIEKKREEMGGESGGLR